MQERNGELAEGKVITHPEGAEENWPANGIPMVVLIIFGPRKMGTPVRLREVLRDGVYTVNMVTGFVRRARPRG